MAKIQNPTKVITGVTTRWSYANVWDAKSINGGAPKYSVSLIIPKSDTVTVNKIKAAIEAAYEEGQSKLKGNGKTVPALSILKTPLRDGDLERPDDPAYAKLMLKAVMVMWYSILKPELRENTFEIRLPLKKSHASNENLLYFRNYARIQFPMLLR